MHDPEVYPEPHEFQPERWLETDHKAAEFDAIQFTFGMGPRVCIGKDIAFMEMFKLLPEVCVFIEWL